MSTRGWQLFLEEFFCGSDDYFSYIQDGAAFAGLFTLVDNYGTPCDKKGGPPPSIDRFPHPGMGPFVDVVSDIMQLLRRWNGRRNALAEWMGLVHDLAELNATPRLQGSTDIWVGSDDSRLNALLHRNVVIDGPPNPAIIGHFNRDVFTSSATAIDLLLDPQSHFVWRPFELDSMPPHLHEVFEQFPAIAGVEEHATTQTAPTVTANKPPDFMFANNGDIWKLRFRYGNNEGECESKEFGHVEGYEYYQRLLQSGSNGLEALDISPPNSSPQSSSAIDEDEYLDGQSDDDTHTLSSGIWKRLSEGELAEFANEIDVIENELSSDSVKANKELKQELKRRLRDARRNLKTKLAQNPDAKPIFAAINRVKGCLRRAIKAMEKDDRMPRLAKYLRDQVKQSGYGWRYANDPPAQWVFTVPPNM